MMQTEQHTSIVLNHRNYFGVKGNEKLNKWMVASADGEFSIFDTVQVITHGSLNQPISGIDFLPQQELMAWFTDSKMFLQQMSGAIILERTGSYKTLFFASDQRLLWVVESRDGKTAFIEALNIENGSTVASIEIDDVYGESVYGLYPGAGNNHLVLFMAAGQDGQSVFFLRLENGIITVDKLPQEDTGPAVFNKGATRYVQSSDEAMSVYNYPQNDLFQTIEYTATEPAYYFGFINENEVIIAGSNLPSIVHIDTGQQEPLIIKGHEPRQFSFYYHSLADTGELTTDIEGVDVFENYALFHCRHHKDPLQEKHSIVILPTTAI